MDTSGRGPLSMQLTCDCADIRAKYVALEARYVELHAKCVGLEAQLRERSPSSLPLVLSRSGAIVADGISGVLRQVFRVALGPRSDRRATIIAKEVNRLKALATAGRRPYPARSPGRDRADDRSLPRRAPRGTNS